MIVRWSDLLCISCQQTIVDYAWTVDLSPFYVGQCALADVFGCGECRAGVRHGFRDGTTIRSLPDLGAMDQLNAVHEAGHGVIAYVTGQPVTGVEIYQHAQHRGDHDAGGITHFAGPYDVSPDDYAAKNWAGQQASLQWLAVQGINTAADVLDVRFLGWRDIRQTLTDVPGVSQEANLRFRSYADTLVRQHWSSIEAVQRLVLRHGFVDSSQIAVMSKWCPRVDAEMRRESGP